MAERSFCFEKEKVFAGNNAEKKRKIVFEFQTVKDGQSNIVLKGAEELG